MAHHHLAQLNIGIPRGPLDGPVMKEFMDSLDSVNAVADAAPISVDTPADLAAARHFADTIGGPS